MANNPLKQIEPASCDGSFNLEEVKNWESEPNVIYERKYDGIRYLLHIHTGKNFLTSKRISVKNGLYVQKEDKVTKVRDFKFPEELDGTVLDGEIIGGNVSSDTQHEMVTGNVDYTCFDILFLGKEDLRSFPLVDRLMILDRLRSIFPDWLKAPTVFVDPKEGYAESIKGNWEGLIQKALNKPYGKGWVKCKVEETYDCIVIGYTESESDRYGSRGWIKSIVLGQYSEDGVLEEYGQVSGMDEKVRAEVSANKEQYKGRVFELTANLRFPTGKFRHPRFIRWREDKNAKDCIFKKVTTSKPKENRCLPEPKESMQA